MLRSALLCLVFAACAGDRTTRVFVQVEWDGQVPVDQLRVRVDFEGAMVAGPAARPSDPAPEPLEAFQSMRLILPDALADRAVDVVIEGVGGGVVRALGRESVTPKKSAEVEVSLVLERVDLCADCAGCCDNGECVEPTAGKCGASGVACNDCGSRADRCVGGGCACGDGPSCKKGQRCSDGACVCDADACPTGCCAENTCVTRTLARCAPTGDACESCNRISADTCTAAGECACGVGAPCGAGKRCRGGVCVCDGLSCPGGCCDLAGECQSGNTPTACGAGGGTCDVCPDKPGEPGVPQDCDAGVCSGCAATCPGCCSGSTCSNPNPEQCGVLGAACRSCDPDRADTCDASGACMCGENEVCGEGTFCDAGKCVCNSESCTTGCCTARENGQCLGGRDPRSCGNGGNICAPCAECDANGDCKSCNTGNCKASQCCLGEKCRDQGASDDGVFCGVGAETCELCQLDKANGCSMLGACSCNGGAACGSGQMCTGAGCVCNELSCPNGCCNGTECASPSSFLLCGNGGELCDTCTAASANACVGGNCVCGNGPACGTGLRCEGQGTEAHCVCDALSGCAGCCADASTCVESTQAHCGVGGVSCAPCDADQQCVGGACKCTPDSCPDGCCTGDESCKPFAEQEASSCGDNGAMCGGCDPGQACLSGVCTCDPSECDGCCKDNVCLAGTANDACGENGVSCSNCAASNGACDNGGCKCRDDIGSSTTPQKASSCGTYPSCASCGANEVCGNQPGSCVCFDGRARCLGVCCGASQDCVLLVCL